VAVAVTRVDFLVVYKHPAAVKEKCRKEMDSWMRLDDRKEKFTT